MQRDNDLMIGGALLLAAWITVVVVAAVAAGAPSLRWLGIVPIALGLAGGFLLFRSTGLD